MSPDQERSRTITLRGGGRIAWWRFVTGTSIITVSTGLLVAHRFLAPVITGAVGLVVGVVILRRGRIPADRGPK